MARIPAATIISTSVKPFELLIRIPAIGHWVSGWKYVVTEKLLVHCPGVAEVHAPPKGQPTVTSSCFKPEFCPLPNLCRLKRSKLYQKTHSRQSQSRLSTEWSWYSAV